MSAVLLIPFVASGLVDLPRLMHVGPISVLGAMSVVQVALTAAALAVTDSYSRPVLWRLAPYACFVGWMLGRSTIDWPDQNGVQNAFAYALFGLHFLLAGTLVAARAGAAVSLIHLGFTALDTIALSLTAINFLVFGLPTGTGEDLEWLVGPRAVGLLAIVPLSWHLSGWCHGRRRAGLRALIWILAVSASLSRTATAVALVTAAMAFVAQAWITPGRFVRQVPIVVAGAAIVGLLVMVYQAQFRERFFEGYNNVEVAGVEISTSGRDSIWPTVIESAMRHPILGGGLGSSQAALGGFDETVVGHPHNDYLRVWHDGGIVGLVFLLAAFARWLVHLLGRWTRAVRAMSPFPEVHLAALLTLVGIMLAAITDNGFIYAYVMGPAGLLTGAAMGMGAHEPVPRHGRAPAAPATSESCLA
jgi:O-antigen ligase